jgi:uncharacterized protein involved in exopolysaccharide biosynthesis
LLSKQYEAARIDEAKDAPMIQVVDTAVPAEKKSWPPRALFSIAGTICAGLLACLWLVFMNRLQTQAAANC